MASNNWLRKEEFEALQHLLLNGKISPIANLIERNGVAVHSSIFHALRMLDHWYNSLHWQITQTPKASQARVGIDGQTARKGGRPSNKEKDIFFEFKRYRLAMKIAEAHIHFLDNFAREPNKKEVREFIMNDGKISELVGLSGKGRTAQDKMIAEAKLLFQTMR